MSAVGHSITAPASVAGAADEIDRLRDILRAILHADERGQGQPFAEAMEAAAEAVKWGRREAYVVEKPGKPQPDNRGPGR
jgi:predicted short-subunit dehydrogenase-like oxidoreductase (DUF2520 family)